MPTLPHKLPHAKHIKCNVFSSVDCGWLWKKPIFVVGWLWKESVVYIRCLKWCPFAFMHARSRALYWSTALSKMFCRMLLWRYNSDVETRHFRHFTSKQNKVSKSKVVQKVIPVADFECLLMTCAKNYKNWWTCVENIAGQTWDIFLDTLYVMSPHYTELPPAWRSS